MKKEFQMKLLHNKWGLALGRTQGDQEGCLVNYAIRSGRGSNIS